MCVLWHANRRGVHAEAGESVRVLSASSCVCVFLVLGFLPSASTALSPNGMPRLLPLVTRFEGCVLTMCSCVCVT